MGIILSAVTTQTISDLPLGIGSTYISGTTTNLLSPDGGFTLEDMRKSIDLQSKIDSGDIILTSDNDTIVNVNTLGINFFNTYGGTLNGDIMVNGIVSSPVFSGGTFYGDGSGISGLSQSDKFVTGFTLTNSDLVIERNGGLSTLSVELSGSNITITPISGLTATNVQDALIELSVELTETSSNSVFAQMSMSNNAVETVISAPSTPTKALGTTTASGLGLKGFNHSDNRLTYTGTSEVNRLVIGSIYVTADNNNKDAEIYISKNSAVITSSKSPGRIQTSGQVTGFMPQSVVTFNTNDYVEIYLSNTTDDRNLIWVDGSVTIS